VQLTVGDVLPLADRQISVDEARRAIYIDFEGRMDEAPVLLGAAYATGRPISANKIALLHYVLDPTFQCVPDLHDIAPVYRYETRSASLGQALNEVIRLASKRDRLIVSWSQHEVRMVLENGLKGMLAEEFAHRYRDGKETAKRWKRAFHGDVELPRGRSGRQHSLSNYLDLIGYELPEVAYGAGRTGENLKFVRSALELHGNWDHLTVRQQARWREVIGHNTHDCLGLRSVVTRASAELER
jgi:hypothetical protein